jgi:diguanylate cyclase (GGDEF)-like protein/PAS domain S-box-containing protein
MNFVPLRALLVEDSEDDSLQIVRLLKAGGYAVEHERVSSREAMTAALDRQPWDVVIADFRMPGFGGLSALALLRERDANLPFIVVSGTIGEDTAVAMMKAGASDYVMKKDLTRLAPAITRELREARVRLDRGEAREALRESELRFRQLAETIRDVFFIQDLTSSRMFYVSPAYEEIWGRTCESLYAEPDSWADSIHPEDHDRVLASFINGMARGFDHEFRILRPDGETRWLRVRGFPILDDQGKPYRTAGVASDITRQKLAEENLRHSESVKGAILGSSPDSIITMDGEGKIVEFNPAAEAAFGITREEALGKPMAPLIIPPRHREAHARGLAHFLASGEGPALGKRVELHAMRADGSEFPIDLTITSIGTASRQLFTGFIRDITDRKASEARIKRLNRVYAVLSGINSLIVRVGDREELFREACRIAVEHGAFQMAWIGVIDPQTLDGKVAAWAGGEEGYVDKIMLTARAGTPGSERPACRALRRMQPVICNDIAGDPALEPIREELTLRGHRSLACFPLTVSGGPEAVLALFSGDANVFDEEETRLLLELAGDISFAMDHIEKAEKLNYLAYYDALTGLANRSLFLERVEQKLIAAAATGQKVAIFALDVERFRTINDALGRQAGDDLLKQIAERFRRASGDDSRLARLDGDHFAIVSSDAQTEEMVARMIETRLETCFGPPFVVGGSEMRVSAKLGVAVFPGDGANAETLLTHAKTALKRAKSSGQSYVFFAEEMTERVAEKLALENRLRHALEKDEFVLHYQPKVDLRTGRIVGVEALIRWESPELGLVPPLQFIPLLEETGLILPVGAWALRRAAADHRLWLDRGLAAPRVAVNVSEIQLRQRDFVQVVETVIGPGTPCGIDLELTESMVMQDVQANIEKLRALSALGVRLAIDDFGTGYSSLGYLAKLPAHSLKIDRSFVITMHDDPNSMTLVSTIISLAHSLRLKVIAEGVETEEQAKLLRLLNCDEMQGFLFSRPLPFEALTELLEDEAEAASAAPLGDLPLPHGEIPDGRRKEAVASSL